MLVALGLVGDGALVGGAMTRPVAVRHDANVAVGNWNLKNIAIISVLYTLLHVYNCLRLEMAYLSEEISKLTHQITSCLEITISLSGNRYAAKTVHHSEYELKEFELRSS